MRATEHACEELEHISFTERLILLLRHYRVCFTEQLRPVDVSVLPRIFFMEKLVVHMRYGGKAAKVAFLMGEGVGADGASGGRARHGGMCEGAPPIHWPSTERFPLAAA